MLSVFRDCALRGASAVADVDLAGGCCHSRVGQLSLGLALHLWDPGDPASPGAVFLTEEVTVRGSPGVCILMHFNLSISRRKTQALS